MAKMVVATPIPAAAVVGRWKKKTSQTNDRLGRDSGLDLCRRLVAQHPDTKVVFLTVYDDEHYLYQALRAGGAVEGQLDDLPRGQVDGEVGGRGRRASKDGEEQERDDGEAAPRPAHAPPPLSHPAVPRPAGASRVRPARRLRPSRQSVPSRSRTRGR